MRRAVSLLSRAARPPRAFLPPLRVTEVLVARDFPLCLGNSLPELRMAYAEWGPRDGPLVLVMPSMSHSRFVLRQSADSPPGWWENVIGEGPHFGIDVSRFRILSASPLGGPFGSTSPLSINPQTGKKYLSNFPQITPEDQARAVAALLEVLGEPKVFAVLGGSMGGMQALMFGGLFPDRYERLSAIACTGATSPSTVALRSIQRKAVLADPAYQGGCYPDGCGPVSGMGVARAIGTICYRSRNEFDERFEWKARPDHSFQVESYLSHQAKKFQTSFDANCWLLLSRNMDLMDMGRGFPNFAKGVTRIPQDKEVMLLSIKQDALIQSKEMTMLASILGAHGVKVHYEELSSKFGHDAFLLEQDMFNPRLNAFLGAAGGEGHDGVDAVRALIREMHE